MDNEKLNLETEDELENNEEILEKEPDAEDLAVVEELSEDALKALTQITSAPSAKNSAFQNYLIEVSKYPLLTREEEIELFKKLEAGHEEAKDQLILCNLRLVTAISRQAQLSYKNIEIMDVINAATCGLTTAIEKFDYHKGFKFSTYATWWVSQAATRFIEENCRLVRLPSHVTILLKKIYKFVINFNANTGREPVPEEVYEFLNQKYSLEKVKEYMELLSQTGYCSLDASPVKGEDGSFYDIVQDPNNNDDENYHAQSGISALLENVLSGFKPIERRIIALRYGLNGETALTLEDVGQKVYEEGLTKKRVTRERVRQIERDVLAKIRKSPSIMRRLQELM